MLNHFILTLFKQAWFCLRVITMPFINLIKLMLAFAIGFALSI